jgi:protocatechuate 3,4-dioxygenase beta subunit
VVDEQGLPVSDVKILVQNPGNKEGQIENVDFQTCPITNREDGSWSCSYIPRDYTNEIRFILQKPGYATTFPVVPVARVDLKNLVLVIGRGFAITGQVTDAQGQPVADAIIKTLDGEHNKRRSAKTDEQGYFTLIGVPGETGPGMLSELPPLRTNEFGGVIVQGIRPKSGPTVMLTPETLRRIENMHAEGMAELGRGRAFLERLQKMTREELAEALPSTDVQDTTIKSLLEQLAVHEQELVSLTKSGGPQGAEAQEAGAALAELKEKVDVQAQRVLQELDAMVSSFDKSLEQMQEEVDKSIAQGKAAPSPLHAELSIQAKGFMSRTATVNLVNATNTANFCLSQGRAFRGQVVDEAGNPIANAVVRTDYNFQSQVESPFDWKAHTDATGRFEWDSAPAEEICYWFEAEGYKRLRGLRFVADGTDHEITLQSREAR